MADTPLSLEAELLALRQEVRKLSNGMEILDCIVRHSRGCDRHDDALISDSYFDDAFDEHGFAVARGPGYASWANSSHASSSLTHTHNITTHSCAVDGDVAHAESYVICRTARTRRQDCAVHQRPLPRLVGTPGRPTAHRAPALDGRSDVHRRMLRAAGLVLQEEGLHPGNA